ALVADEHVGENSGGGHEQQQLDDSPGGRGPFVGRGAAAVGRSVFFFRHAQEQYNNFRPMYSRILIQTRIDERSNDVTDIVLILTTVPDGSLGDRLARSLVEDRLAACVNAHG